MRTRLPFVAVAVAAVSAGALSLACPACSGDSARPSAIDSGAPTPDGGPADDATSDAGEAGPPGAYVRLAHWSPDAPAIDVCFAPPGEDWTAQVPRLLADAGPGADASAGAGADASAGGDASGGAKGDGGPGEAGALGDGGGFAGPGVAFPQVTSYLELAPDTYAVRLVTAGASDCSTALVELAAVKLAAGSFTTVAAVGDATPGPGEAPLKIVSFLDDVTAPAGQIALRFVNASPGLMTVDFGTGSLSGAGGAFAPLFRGVAFGQAGAGAESDAGAVDANGYLAAGAYAGATLSAHVTATATDTATAANDVDVRAGSAATMALIGRVTGGGSAELLQCADADDTSTGARLAQCEIVSQ
jgi:Domain of unknown function (DUF4397)